MHLNVVFVSRSGGKVIERNLGRLVYTRGASALIDQTRGGGKKAWGFLQRHAVGDCPHLDPEDREANAHGVMTNGYLLTSWDLPKGKIWIITEHDRSATTILTPEEY